MDQGWKARAEAAKKRNHYRNDVNEVRRRFYDLKKKGLKNEDAAAIAMGKLDPPEGLGLPEPQPLPQDDPPPAPTDDNAAEQAETESTPAPDDKSSAESEDNPDPAEESKPEVEGPAPVAAPEDDEADELDEDLKPI